MRSLPIAALGVMFFGATAVAVASAADSAATNDKTEPTVDRVGFPADYAARFLVIRTTNKTQVNLLGTIFANDKSASIAELSQLPYPPGSILVMEWAEPLKGDDGTLLTDADGLWRKGKVVRVDVMRREIGYGESYGESRSGEWEFASYRPDGSYLQPPAKAVSCAACHQTASAARDFVFRGRFPALEKE